MRQTNQLTALKVAKLSRQGRYGDGCGLWLQIGPTGAKSWLLRFQRAGKARQMGLGPLHTIGLAEARDIAREARKQILAGLDPIEARRTARIAAAADTARSLTFRAAAEAYIAAHRAGWKNPVHANQWPSTLGAYAYPVFGHLPVSAIDTAQVMKAVEPIWRTKPETASRVRNRIELILAWAAARGHRSGDNPARWRGHLDKLLPPKGKTRPVRHHPALPYRDLPKFMAAIRRKDFVAARALEFTILTAARTGEAIGAKWEEIDFRTKLWVIPAARMKAGRDHRVPLPDRAVSILKKLPRESDYVFIGAKKNNPLSNMAMLEMLKDMGRDDVTVHGFRSTFRDWAAEQTNFPREVCEMALAHTVGDKVEAAYRRGDLFKKRQSLTQEWSDFCSSRKNRRGVK